MSNKKLFKPKHPLVILFGAGASKGGLNDELLSPPVDKDFFDTANLLKGQGTPKVTKKVLKSIWELYQKTSSIGLEEYYRDIETRAIISRFAKSANKPKNWKNRQSDLEELIQRVCVHTTVDLTKHKPIPRHSFGS